MPGAAFGAEPRRVAWCSGAGLDDRPHVLDFIAPGTNDHVAVGIGPARFNVERARHAHERASAFAIGGLPSHNAARIAAPADEKRTLIAVGRHDLIRRHPPCAIAWHWSPRPVRLLS